MKSKSVPIAKLSKISLLFLLLSGLSPVVQAEPEAGWNDTERTLLRLQWIGSLPDLAPDPTNKYAEDPAAARLGHHLFFDKRFSSNQQVSCASCHHPDKSFTDGLAKARGVGETTRSAPSLVGMAYSPWFFWDGRSDSMWSQALGPMESAVEHGGNRSQYARIIYNDPLYREMYEQVFGPLPDLADEKRFPENAAPIENRESSAKWQAMAEPDRKAITRVYVNMGKAIAAYERKLIPAPARFDKYAGAILSDTPAAAEGILSADEVAGLKIFIGKGLCVTCHQGPLFTHNGFHNTGVPDPAAVRHKETAKDLSASKPLVDEGRYKGIQQALASEFNCLGEYSDATEEDCSELKFATTKKWETLASFKVPTLRNIADTAPYMHAGQFESLDEVLRHYNALPRAYIGRSDLIPVNLNQKEQKQLEAFLRTLSSPVAAEPEWLQAPGS